jgi:hypothetical protein
LRVSEVHHFVKEFVDDDEIVSYAFFFELFEVLGEDFDDLVEEEEDFGGIGVSFRESEEEKVVVADIEVLGKKRDIWVSF